MLTDAQWAVLEPLVEVVRSHAKVPPGHLRRTVGAILWRHDNGAKWRSLPDVPGWVIADRGYSSHVFREHIRDLGARPAIPPRSNEAPVACPDWIYVHRNQVERLWARLKEWRAVATRYEKTARSYMGVLALAATMDWLRR